MKKRVSLATRCLSFSSVFHSTSVPTTTHSLDMLASSTAPACRRLLSSRSGNFHVHPQEWIAPSHINSVALKSHSVFDATEWARLNGPRAKKAQYLCRPVSVSSAGGKQSSLLCLHNVQIRYNKPTQEKYGHNWALMAIPTTVINDLLSRFRVLPTFAHELVQGEGRARVDNGLYTTFPVYLSDTNVYMSDQGTPATEGLLDTLQQAGTDLEASVAFKVTLKHRGQLFQDFSKAPMSLHLSPRIIWSPRKIGPATFRTGEKA